MDIKLFTAKEVAEILKVHERTIYRYIDEGILAAYKINDGFFRKSKIVIPDFALKKFLEAHTSDIVVNRIIKNKDFLKDILRDVKENPSKENISRLEKVLSVF